MNNGNPSTETFELEKGSELRFEVVQGKKIQVKVTEGRAEVFGYELLVDKEYDLQPGNFGIFTFHGCKIDVIGPAEEPYVSEETPMFHYLNTEHVLNQMRLQSKRIRKRDLEASLDASPRVMICGDVGVGKSTLSKILLNYAVRKGKPTLYVDCDVGQGAVTVPGAPAAVVVTHPIDMSGFSNLSLPLVYHYGDTAPGKNPDLYMHVCELLANAVDKRLEEDETLGPNGVIINTCGWIEGLGKKQLMELGSLFKANVIIVIDNERLTSELKRHYQKLAKESGDPKAKAVQVIRLPKSGGVVSHSQTARKASRDRSIRNYFYGTDHSFSPHNIVVPFSEVVIYQAGGEDIPDSVLPLGMTQADNKKRMILIEPSEGLRDRLCSVSVAQRDDAEGADILRSNIAGFVVITNVNMTKQLIHCLSPRPGPGLPSKYLIASAVQFRESA
eukprot:Clim_evm26s202 gene=Clim_evmTU26s202